MDLDPEVYAAVTPNMVIQPIKVVKIECSLHVVPNATPIPEPWRHVVEPWVKSSGGKLFRC